MRFRVTPFLSARSELAPRLGSLKKAISDMLGSRGGSRTQGLPRHPDLHRRIRGRVLAREASVDIASVKRTHRHQRREWQSMGPDCAPFRRIHRAPRVASPRPRLSPVGPRPCRYSVWKPESGGMSAIAGSCCFFFAAFVGSDGQKFSFEV